MLAGIGLILVGLGFKAAVIPFHQWTPDVYEGAPTSVTAYMAGGAKIGAFAAILRVFDALTGKDLGALLIQTGNHSFKVRGARAVGDVVLVSDSVNRTLVYSLKTGEQRGKILGHAFAMSADGKKLVVENGKGKMDLYDVNTLQPLSHFTFATPIEHVEFSADNNSMLVLTADQTVYSLKASAQ